MSSQEQNGMLQQIKALKRRGVETLFQKIGVSDPTLDPEYEHQKKRFDKTIRELGELGVGMSSFMEKCREMYRCCSELAEVTHEYYGGRLIADWPSTPDHLKCHTAAAKLKETWTTNNDATRRSVSQVCAEQGLTPLRAFVNAILPEIQSQADLRQAFCRDFDSYRRRVAATKEKQSKLADPHSQKAIDLEKELTTLQGKLASAEDNYCRQNSKVKEDMVRGKVARDEMIEQALLTMVACQIELFEHTARSLNSLVACLPAEKLNPVRGQIQALIAAGGPEAKSPEPPVLEQTLKSASELPPSFKSQEELEKDRREQSLRAEKARQLTLQSPTEVVSPAVPPPSAMAVPATYSQTTRHTSPPRSVGSQLSMTTGSIGSSRASSTSPAFGPPTAAGKAPSSSITTAPPPPPQGLNGHSGSKKTLARALYDNEAEDETELSFNANDVLEILSRDESGWWEARLKGRVGAIPANYVELIR